MWIVQVKIAQLTDKKNKGIYPDANRSPFLSISRTFHSLREHYFVLIIIGNG